MDIFGILDPDPQENLCGSETLGNTKAFKFWFMEEKMYRYILIFNRHLQINEDNGN